MKLLAALAAGYLLGARTAGPNLDEILRSLRAVRDSEEFQDLLASLRAHAAHVLRELATVVERGPGAAPDVDLAAAQDLVEQVRNLAGLR